VLDKYSDLLVTSDLQLGFNARRSTNMCSMVLKETISYYVNSQSTLYCTLLDAKKAFGRVEYSRLFRIASFLGICHQCLFVCVVYVHS